MDAAEAALALGEGGAERASASSTEAPSEARGERGGSESSCRDTATPLSGTDALEGAAGDTGGVELTSDVPAGHVRRRRSVRGESQRLPYGGCSV